MRFLVLMTLAAGCVGKGKYTALETEMADYKSQMQQQIDTQTAKSMSLEEALAAEEARSASLDNQIKDLESRNTTLLKDKSQLDASIKEMSQALAELAQRKAAADDRINEYKNLLAKFKDLIDAGRLKVKITGGRMVVELATDILFASGSASLSAEGKEALIEVAGVLAEIADREFQVEGHTDNDPISTERFPSNWELAAGRSITVVQTLQEGGVSIASLSAASFSDNRPVASNKTNDGKAANRRIEIVVVPDLSLLPGYEALEALASDD